MSESEEQITTCLSCNSLLANSDGILCVKCYIQYIYLNDKYYRTLVDSLTSSRIHYNDLIQQQKVIDHQIQSEQQIVNSLQQEIKDLQQKNHSIQEQANNINMLAISHQSSMLNHFKLLHQTIQTTQQATTLFNTNYPYQIQEVDLWESIFDVDWDRNGPIINGINVVESFKTGNNRKFRVAISFILLQIIKTAELIGFHSNTYAFERTAHTFSIVTGRSVIHCNDFSTNKGDRQRLQIGLKHLLGVVKEIGEHTETLTNGTYSLPFKIMDDQIQNVSIYPDTKLDSFGIALKFLLTDIMSIRCYQSLTLF
ncbi:Atg6 BARA domain-containing protein [Entamoeba marina]